MIIPPLFLAAGERGGRAEMQFPRAS
jgi:hypothetical protein